MSKINSETSDEIEFDSEREYRTATLNTLVFPVIALVFGIVILLIIHRIYFDKQLTELRSVAQKNGVRTVHLIEGEVRDRLRRMESFGLLIELDTAFSEAAFEKLAKKVIGSGSGIRNVSLAAGGVISSVYPLEKNEKALGLDLLNDPRRKPMVQRAIDTKRTVLQGPLNLKVGGVGLVARSPIFVESEQGSSQFWGNASMVLDLPFIIGQVADQRVSEGFELAWRFTEKSGRTQNVFFGDSAIFDGDVVIVESNLLGAIWEVGVIPATGWPNWATNAGVIYGGGGALILLVFAVNLRLSSERRRWYKAQNLAAEALRESEAQLLHILDNSPFGVSICSRESRERLYVNRRFTEMFAGRSSKEILSWQSSSSFVEEKKLDENWAVFERDGSIAGTEEQRKRVDGTNWWCLADWRTISFGGEEAAMIWNIDITDRKKVEEDIRENQRQLATLFSNLPGIAFRNLADEHWTVEFVSDGCKKLTGYDPKDLINNHRISFEEIVLPADRKHLRDEIKESLLTGPNYQVAYRIQTIDGEIKHVWESGIAIYCNDGQLIAYEGIISDISNLKEAEKELLEKTTIVELQRQTAREANAALNYDEALRTCLDTICSFVGWPAGHVYFRDTENEDTMVSTDIWHLDDPDRFVHLRELTKNSAVKAGGGFVSKVLSTRQPVWIENLAESTQVSRVKQAKSDIEIRSGFALPVLSKNEVVAVLEFFTDEIVEQDDSLLNNLIHIGAQLSRVFERKEAEMELRAAMGEIDAAKRSLEQRVEARTLDLHKAKDEAVMAKQDAEAANRTKTEFLANMSHELRTPLNAIIGFSDMMKGAMFGPLDSKYQEYATDINDAGAHLLKIISDILDLAKVEVGELDIDDVEVDFLEVTAVCEMMAGDRAEESGVTLEFDLASDLPPLYADPLRVKQILMNLLTNSIKFTPRGGRISVAIETSVKSGLMMVVRDTGIGIAEEDIATVLEKFGQVRDGHACAHEGAGLGLAISKSLMELHDGTLCIESKIDRGTIVTATFPPDRSKNPSDRLTSMG